MSVAEAPVKPKRVRKPKAEAPPPPAPPAEAPAKPAPKPRTRKPKAEGTLTPTADPGNPLALLAKLPAPVVGDLSKDQQARRYAQMKRIISLGLHSWVVMGAALAEIRDHKLYVLDRYSDFEDFVQTEWDLGSKQRASQLITRAATFVALKDYLEAQGVEIPLPQVESHVAQLGLLDTVEEQAKAWQQAYATAERKTGDRLRLTAAHVEAVVKEHQGFKALPPTGPGTNTPTPPEQPPLKEQVPATAEAPEDTVPPEDVAPPAGEEPDTLEGFVPAAEEIEIVKAGGKPTTLTPTVAMQYLIKALKGGYLSHRDPLVQSLAEVVQEALVTWIESPHDAVEIDYAEGDVPDFAVTEDDVEDDGALDLADGPADA